MAAPKRTKDARWLWTEEGFEPRELENRETRLTLANGYMGLRGSHEASPLRGSPGFYIAGVYDRMVGHVDEIVNQPLPLQTGFNLDGFDIDLGRGRVLEMTRTLDMRQGLLFTEMLYEDAIKRRYRYESTRLVHKKEKHLVLLWGSVTPLDAGGGLTASNLVDAWAVKHGSGSKRTHFTDMETRDFGSGVAVDVTMKEYGIRVSVASQLKLKGVQANRGAALDDDRAEERLRARVRKGQTVHFEKRIVACTSRDVDDPEDEAVRLLDKYERRSVSALAKTHTGAWAKVWDEADVRIAGDDEAQRQLRWSLFHLASLANPEDEWVSFGAKGLHGPGYNGQVFWDTEIYLVPFFIHTDPKAARALLMYRYNFLPDARENAKEFGRRGAKYPWNSSSQTSRERANDTWQQHLGPDIAWAVTRYVEATGDAAFYRDYGAQLIVETAAYWLDRVAYNEAEDRYEILHLTGPDELHGGVDNNVTTNFLARQHLYQALEAVGTLKEAGRWAEVRKLSRMKERDVETMREMAEKMYVPYDARRRIHPQFDGYFKLKERKIDRSMTKMQYIGPVQHSFKPTKVAQQADVMMMYQLYPESFDAEVKRAGFGYYEPRCSHTSTLSRCIFSAVAARAGLTDEALRLFRASLQTDLGPTAECGSGIHAACLGGNWLAAVAGFAGFSVQDGVVRFDPHLPEELGKLAFRVKARKRVLNVEVTPKRLRLSTDKGKLTVEVAGREVTVGPRTTEVACGD